MKAYTGARAGRVHRSCSGAAAHSLFLYKDFVWVGFG